MAELEPAVYWLVIAGLAIALAVSVGALWRARRSAREAQREAEEMRGAVSDPVGARLLRLDMEIESLGSGRAR